MLLPSSVLLATPAFADRSSCPLTTKVHPFLATSSTRYEITVVDGGPGDLDGVADGVCSVALGLCVGSTQCADTTAEQIRVSVSGGSPDMRADAEDRLMQSLLDLAGAGEQAPGMVGLAGDTQDIGEQCTTTQLRIPAVVGPFGRLAFRLRVSGHDARGRSLARRSRPSITCLDAGTAELRSASLACRSVGRSCPPVTHSSCGNGTRNGNEQCDGADSAACPGRCSSRCTCPIAPVPVCGDGVRNTPSEQCDGGDDAACPGACQADCTCPLLPAAVCGNGVREGAAERCDGSDDVECPGDCRPDCMCGTLYTTGNIAPAAHVTASSASPSSPATAAVDGIMDGVPGDGAHEWVSAGEQGGAWLRLEWPSPVTIDRVVLHDRPSSVDNLLGGTVLVDGAEAAPIGPLPAEGRPAEIMIGPRSLLALTIMLNSVAGTDAGLSEVEAIAADAPRPPTTGGGSGTTYYISPSGSDDRSGTSADQAWKTFGKAIPALHPGDTLIVGDGTYTRDTTGLPVVDCGGSAHDGTSSDPIWIQAAHERQAWLKSDGIGDAFYMNNCSNWNVIGLRGSSADNTGAKPWEGNVFRIANVDNVQLRRLLAVRPNRTCPNGSLSYCNAHAIAVEKSHHMVIEECETYDFHRHGISVFGSRYVDVRRCYMNSRGAPGAGGGPTGIIFYGTSDGLIENCIAEDTVGLNIAGTTCYDGTPGGYRNKLLGNVMLGNRYGSTIRSRYFGGPVLPVGHNTVKDSVYARTENVGVYSRGAADTVLENVTLYGARVDAGFAADQDLGEGAPCSANPDGCSVTARNVLTFNNAGAGARIDGSVMSSWLIEGTNSYGNGGGNFPSSEDVGDTSGNIRQSMSVAPAGMGLGAGQCILWAPDGSNMRGAGKGGADIGARVLYRYQAGSLTTQPLWDRSSGAFPCGATVGGVNDVSGRSCNDVHRRLNANTNGCSFPAGY